MSGDSCQCESIAAALRKHSQGGVAKAINLESPIPSISENNTECKAAQSLTFYPVYFFSAVATPELTVSSAFVAFSATADGSGT